MHLFILHPRRWTPRAGLSLARVGQPRHDHHTLAATTRTPLLRTAYIDAVATLPNEQGQGIGSAVMRQLAVDMTAYEIGCVETERTPFYERLGRELWRGALADRNGDELLPTLEQKGIMIPRLEPTRRLT